MPATILASIGVKPSLHACDIVGQIPDDMAGKEREQPRLLHEVCVVLGRMAWSGEAVGEGAPVVNDVDVQITHGQ